MLFLQNNDISSTTDLYSSVHFLIGVNCPVEVIGQIWFLVVPE